MQKLKRDDFLLNYGIENHSTIEVFDKLKTFAANGWVMAGGAVRALVTSMPVTTDYDLFFFNEADFSFMEQGLRQAGAIEMAKTEHHVTFDFEAKKIQLIKIQFYADVDAVLDSFDYTICQLAIDSEHLYLGDTALWDLARKKLVVHKITFAAASVRRMLKYQLHGFTICQGAIRSLLEAVATNPSLIQSNIQYVD